MREGGVELYWTNQWKLFLIEFKINTPQDFYAKGESTRTARFHFKTK